MAWVFRRPPPRIQAQAWVPTFPTPAVDWEQPVDDTLALSDAISLGYGLTVADSVTMSDAVAFGRDVHVADSVTPSDALQFDRDLHLADSVTMSDATALGRDIHLADSVSMSDLATPAGARPSRSTTPSPCRTRRRSAAALRSPTRSPRPMRSGSTVTSI